MMIQLGTIIYRRRKQLGKQPTYCERRLQFLEMKTLTLVYYIPLVGAKMSFAKMNLLWNGG